ncbi:MAG: family 10 glycosylhydrolase [Cyanobacteria bacterium J06581_3]
MLSSYQILKRGSLALSALIATTGLIALSIPSSKNQSKNQLLTQQSKQLFQPSSAERFSLTHFLLPSAIAADSLPTTHNSSAIINVDTDLFLPLSGLEQQNDLPQLTQATTTWREAWESKEIRGIYMSRYRITNNATEAIIRNRVRYYKQQGINTIIHGVWGNGCPMYKSNVMYQTFGKESCPNNFQDQWLDWLIDEAHAHGMQVHAYFEKGIKLDVDSPIFPIAQANNWFVPGIDRTYASVDHYVLDVENPQVSQFFEQILAEFVQRYPTIDAVQWDDYLGYYAGLGGNVDRTAQLTSFVQRMRTGMKAVNPNVSFDICHHNPYWGARYFAADWQNWGVDRAFIQAYNDANFYDELGYIEQSAGVAISDNQLHRLGDILSNPNIKSVLIFPNSGNPVEAARRVNATITGQ